jgi:flagellar biosynthesis chaperone FliJ
MAREERLPEAASRLSGAALEANGVPPKTRLDRVVTVRERSEESALQNLAHAQTGVSGASSRLAGLRQVAREDRRSTGTAELWVLEELGHLRSLQQVQKAEGALAQALRQEQTARAGYTAAHRSAEIVRRAQDKKRVEILGEREKDERKGLEELATLRFNARSRESA